MTGRASIGQALCDRRLAGLMVEAQDGDRLAYRQLLAIVALRAMEAHAAHSIGTAAKAGGADAFTCCVLNTVHAALATYDPRYSFEGWLSAIISARLARPARRRRTAMRAARLEPREIFLGPHIPL